MELYHWVHALTRFALNMHEAELSLAQILGTAEVLIAHLVIFFGFLFSVSIFLRKMHHR